MSARSRNKGVCAEREVAALLRDWLGLAVRRNWQGQAAVGGADLSGVPGWAVEVKRAKAFRNAWWEQAESQARLQRALPALVFLLDQTRPGLPAVDRWRVLLPLGAIARFDLDAGLTAEVSLRAWLQILREQLAADSTITDTMECPHD